MVKCKYEGTGIWDGRCTGTKEVDTCHGYDKCKQYKPNYTTNADRIRAMSDEELARQFGAQCPKTSKRVCDKRCHLCWLEWLRQLAEEDIK